MKKQNLKYIVRFETKNHKAWQFRFADYGYNCEGKRDHASFSDNQHGGKTKSLEAAIKFRDRYLKKNGNYKFLLKYKNPKRYRHSLNKSGVLGVILVERDRGDKVYQAWHAYGHTNHIGWRRSFGVNKYGFITAFKKACNARYLHHGVLYIFCNISELPASPGVPYKKIKR